MGFSRFVELVTAACVIVSLVFVGFEVRQNTQVARGQARQELASLNQEWLLLVSTDTKFNELWDRAWIQGSELSDLEQRQATAMMLMNLRRLENVFLQYREGLVSESALSSYGFQGLRLYEGAPFRQWWPGGQRGFDSDFAAYFNQRFGISAASGP